MKKNLIPALSLGLLSLLASCASGSGVANKDKPLIWWNRQPSDPTTGAVDTKAMSWNNSTYYIGFDAAGGGDVQGKMITDYLKTKTKAELDKNEDGKLGYVLCIGDIAHNDSNARTKGIRKALGTLKDDSTDPAVKKAGSVTVKDGTLEVEELAAKEMKSTAGATWDATTAGETVPTWVSQQGTKIDMFVSNNDGMAMGCLKAATYPAGTPIFGYDANKDALASIKDGKLTGTVSQNVDAQACSVLMVIRNLLDGVTGSDVYTKGFSTADKYGNKITPTVDYVAASKAVLAQNSAVTASNVNDYYNADKDIRDAGIKDVTAKAPAKKVLLTIYNGSDNFLSGSYKPCLKYYAPLMNLNLTYIEGDGQSESVILDKFANLSNYDAYAINMVKTNSGADYTSKLA